MEDNTRFAKEYDADFPILADPEKKTSEAYGVLMPQGYAKRWTFYIDKESKIKHIEKKVRTAAAAEDTLKMLSELGLTESSDDK